MARLDAFVVVLTFLVHVTPGEAATSGDCQTGWNLSHGFNVCLRVFESPMTWVDASRHCQDNDAVLLEFPNSPLAFGGTPIRIRQNIHYWIGLNDRVTEGSYKWNNKTENVANFNWATTPVAGDEKDCVSYMWRHGFMWYNHKCDEKYQFVCQRPRNVLTTPSPPRVKECPEGWKKYAPSETCFKVMAEKRRQWQKARDECKEMEADLAVIPDQETMDFVKDIAKTGRYWIGLVDKGRNGTFSWLGPNTETEFKAWRNPPRNLMGDEYCVEMIGPKEGKWNDKSCRAKKHFICERAAALPS